VSISPDIQSDTLKVKSPLPSKTNRMMLYIVHISSLQFILEEMSRLRVKFYVTIILKIYIQTKI